MKNFFITLKYNTFNLAKFIKFLVGFICIIIYIFIALLILLSILGFFGICEEDLYKFLETTFLFPVIFLILLLQIFFIIGIGIYILYYIIYFIFQNFKKRGYKYPRLFTIICISILLLLLLCFLNFPLFKFFIKRLFHILPIIMLLIQSIIFIIYTYNNYKPEFLFFMNIYLKCILYLFIFILFIILWICFTLSYVDFNLFNAPLNLKGQIENSIENLIFPAKSPLDSTNIIDLPTLYVQEDLDFQKEYSEFKSKINRVEYIWSNHVINVDLWPPTHRFFIHLDSGEGDGTNDAIMVELNTLQLELYHKVDPLLSKLNKVKGLELDVQNIIGKTYYRDNYDQLHSYIEQYKDENSNWLLNLDPNKVRHLENNTTLYYD